MIAYYNRTVLCCLALLGVAWIVRGTISPANLGIYWVVRHLIQVSPLLVAMIVVAGRPGWTASICAPLFVVWLWGMFTLWNFWASIPAAVDQTRLDALAVIIAVIAVLGVTVAVLTRSNLRFAKRMTLCGSAFAVQLTALFLGSLIQ